MPSSVVMAFPLTAATGVTHERISFPSSSTEQAPHCARPQPKRGPCRCSSLCRTYSRGVSRLAVTLCTRPFTLIFNLLATRFLLLASAGTTAPRIRDARPGWPSKSQATERSLEGQDFLQIARLDLGTRESEGLLRRAPRVLLAPRYTTPAALSVARTFAGFIGAIRSRTPVASKNAFATAELTAVSGGSPEPLRLQP